MGWPLAFVLSVAILVAATLIGVSYYTHAVGGYCVHSVTHGWSRTVTSWSKPPACGVEVRP